ncbi:MAG: exonuclease domain-containing protein [Cellvibrio sp.]|uniref:3'-5' exonuclease family protein n=1 Tax=Cellvibrio sp. TaxID=1965322 RepID=UPI0031B15E24
MLKYIPTPCVIVDIETTGGNVTHDRITEIGIIEVTEDGVKEWSTLINPRAHIPEGIQLLTGITNEMVLAAPYFEQVAKEILLRLQGKLFIAHNVRFDYGFIRNEFARLAYSFKSKLMCTVKLSRFLYPDSNGHSLEKIIARHQIYVTHRHRALDDAKATLKFMAIAEEEKGEELVKEAIKHQYRKESMPANFDSTLILELPNSPGVYYFWGEKKELLYVGKSINIRKRVLSHFTADHKSSREMKICQQTRNITFDKTTGELTALILESRKVKELQPIYNRKLRRISSFYSIQLEEGHDGILKPQIVSISEMPITRKKLYGLFPSIKKANQAIQSICNERNLCYQVCGFEKTNNRACSSHQLKKCKGFCVGKQLALQHNVELLDGLALLALKTWPYKGPVSILEEDASGQQKYLVVDNWCVLGIADSPADHAEILPFTSEPLLDRDIYRYLVNEIFSKKTSVRITPLK